MDVGSVGNEGPDVMDAVALKTENVSAGVSVSVMKKALDIEKMIGEEIAKLLGVGANVDVRA